MRNFKKKSMFNLHQIEGTQIYAFTVEGELNTRDLEDFYYLLDRKLEEKEKIKLLAEFKEFPGFDSFKAFSETFKLKFKALTNIEKYAVVSDAGWIKAFTPLGNLLTPRIPIKHFAAKEKDQAITWLNKSYHKTFTEEEYLTQLDFEKLDNSNIYKFTIDGKIDQGAIEALYGIIKNKEEKVNLLAVFKNFDGFDSFKTFLKSIKVDFESISQVNKYAVVSDKKWIERILSLEDKIFQSVDLKYFPLEKETEAIKWLKA